MILVFSVTANRSTSTSVTPISAPRLINVAKQPGFGGANARPGVRNESPLRLRKPAGLGATARGRGSGSLLSPLSSVVPRQHYVWAAQWSGVSPFKGNGGGERRRTGRRGAGGASSQVMAMGRSPTWPR